MSKDYCLGCHVKPLCGLENKGDCPCTECIVKAMCDIDCEDFGDYSDRPRCKDLLNRRLYGEGKNSI